MTITTNNDKLTRKQYQAKDVPEELIMELLQRNPGKWHTHYSHNGLEGSALISIPDTCPQLAVYPLKVLHAKLSSMSRRKLIGGGGHWESRGDWSSYENEPGDRGYHVSSTPPGVNEPTTPLEAT